MKIEKNKSPDWKPVKGNEIKPLVRSEARPINNTPKENIRDCCESVIYQMQAEHQSKLDVNSRAGQGELHEKKQEIIHLKEQSEQETPEKTTSDLELEHSQYTAHVASINAQGQRENEDVRNSSDLAEKKEDKMKTRKDYMECAAQLGRSDLDTKLNPYALYVSLLLLLGISELPINYTSFVILRENTIMTLLMSLVLIVSLPFLAHTTGKLIKQMNEHKRLYLIMLSIIGLFMVGISVVTAELRCQFLSKLDVPEDELIIDKLLFIFVSLILYAVGALASYFAHDSSHRLQKTHNAWVAAERRYKRTSIRVNKKLGKIAKKIASRVTALDTAFRVKQREILGRKDALKQLKNESILAYNRSLTTYQENESKINAQYERLAREYLGDKFHPIDNQIPSLKRYFDDYTFMQY